MKQIRLDRIEINPKIMVGKPVIKGTRIPVELILKMLSQGIATEEILGGIPPAYQGGHPGCPCLWGQGARGRGSVLFGKSR